MSARVSTGRPLPLVDLRIVDGDMKEQPRDGDTTGEVVVRAPWLNRAYLKTKKPRPRFGMVGTCIPAKRAYR